MEVTLIKENAIPLSVWGGGSSRELFIYPEDACYGEKNFLVRLSTATSRSDEEVKYTILPGITRYLLILEGTAKITHRGGTRGIMKPLETIDVFDGGQETVCSGKVKDFNLMLGAGAGGSLGVITGEADMEVLPVPAGPRGYAWLGLYCAAGEVIINCGAEQWVLLYGDLLIIKDFSLAAGKMNLTLRSGATLVRAEVWL